MNNEPVAWMRYRDDGATVITTYQFEGGIPLYRHPYKATPEEQESLLKNADYVIGVLREKIEELEKQQAEIEALKKDNKELHAIAQRMAMAESDARKSLQWFKEAQEK